MPVRFVSNVPSSAGVGGHKDHPYWSKATWTDVRELALRAEDAGFDVVAMPDHLAIAEGATLECFTTLSALAAETSDVTLYPKVTNALFRNPSLLAKMTATLDTIAEGRLKLGFGAGWLGEEMTAYGYEWPDAVERIRRMEEAIEIVDAMWTEEAPSYEGQFYQIENAECRPKPVQTPRPPIAVGGGGEQYTLAVAARHADSWNLTRSSLDMWKHKRNVLENHCKDIGRDPDDIEKSWFGRLVLRETETAARELVEEAQMFESYESACEAHLVGTPTQVCERIEEFVAAGVDEIIVEFVDLPRTDGLELFRDEVMPEFR